MAKKAPEPIDLPITHRQAEVLLTAQARLDSAQAQFTAAADAIVAGHEIEGKVQLVNLDTDQDPPVLRVVPVGKAAE